MELSFTIYVDSEKSEEELLEFLVASIPGASRHRGYIRAGCNLMKFEENFDFNREKSHGSDDPWQYYRYHFDVSPVEPTTVENQRLVASELLSVFGSCGARVELWTDFD